MDSVWTNKYLYSLYEKRQPPLYYLLAAPVMKVLAARFLPLGDGPGYLPVRWDFRRQGNLFIHQRKTFWSMPSSERRGHLLRLFSVFLGGISLFLIYRLARDNFPNHPPLAPAAAGFVACLPQFNFISGAIGNDSLAVLMGSAVLYYLLRLGNAREESRPRNFLLLGLLLALSLLTKFNLLFLFPASLVVIFLKAHDARRWRLAATGIIFTFLLPALLVVVLMFGSGFGTTPLLVLSSRLLRTTPALLTLPRLRLMAWELYQSFWATFGWMTMLNASLLAALAMIATGSLSVRNAGRSVDFGTLIVLASAVGIAAAVSATGLSDKIAELLALMGAGNPYIALTSVFVGTALLANLTTNAAAAAVMFPIALSLSTNLGVNFMPFAIVLMMGSSAFISPASYQTNLMVYGPGGYKFTDFVKMGFPLTIIVGVISIILAPFFFGF